MSDECLFCRIVAGAIPAHKVYEDEVALAFLDIQPLARGHTLIVPRRHAARFEDLDADQAARLWRAVHRISPHVLRSVDAPASTIAINNGREAGQEVAHVHIHLVPRTAEDASGPIHALFRQRPAVAPAELAALAERIRSSVPAPARTASP